MNIYVNLNKMMNYIEEHLEENISYDVLSQFLGVNSYVMQRLFTILCNISITEYLKNRRLSCAGIDLCQNHMKIIDVAIKYQYDNPTSFSRAFQKFHGIKPSQAKQHPEKLKFFAKLVFDEIIPEVPKIEYSIVSKEELILYGKGVKTNEQDIANDAPKHFQNMITEFCPKYGDIPYGMVVYSNSNRDDCSEYWVLYDRKIPGLKKWIIPKSKWLVFTTPSQNPKDIQKTSHDFYIHFMPNCQYKFKAIPELEYYHDNVTDLLIPIED